MAHVKRANKGTSIADLDGHSAGYAASGESQYSRMAAIGIPRNRIIERERRDWSKLDKLVASEIYQVERLSRRLSEATDPAQQARIMERLTKTQKLLARLRLEQQGLAS